MAKRIPFKVLTTAAVAATVGAAAFVPAAVANSEASFSISEVVVEKDGKNFSLALDTYLLMKGADHEFVTKEDGGFINPSFVKSSTGKVFKLTDFISARGATDDGAIEAALELLDANEELAQEVVAGSVTVGADGELDIKDPVVDPDPGVDPDPDPVTELAVESVMAINVKSVTVALNIDVNSDVEFEVYETENPNAKVDVDVVRSSVNDADNVRVLVADTTFETDKNYTVKVTKGDLEVTKDFYVPVETTVPQFVNAEVIGNQIVNLYFSKPVDNLDADSGSSNYYTNYALRVKGTDTWTTIQEATVASATYEATIEVSDDFQKVTLLLESPLETNTSYEIRTVNSGNFSGSAIEDFANIGLPNTVREFSVNVPTDVAVANSLTVNNRTEVVVEFSQPVKRPNGSTARWSAGRTANSVTMLSPTKVRYTFTTHPIPVGEATFTISGVEDAFGNTVPTKEFKKEVSAEAAPKVSEVKAKNDKEFEIIFDKAVQSGTSAGQAQRRAHYVLKDASGNVLTSDDSAGIDDNGVPVNAISYDSNSASDTYQKKVTINLGSGNQLPAGTYQLTVKSVKDLLGTEMAEQTITFVVKDTTAPDNVTGGDIQLAERLMVITFSEPMATTGNHSILRAANYRVDLNDGDGWVRLPAGTTLTATNDNKSVEIKLPSNKSFDDGATKIRVGHDTASELFRVSDVAGNLMTAVEIDTLGYDAAIDISDNNFDIVSPTELTLELTKAIDPATLSAADFRITTTDNTWADAEIEVLSVTANDKGDKLTFTISEDDKFTADDTSSDIKILINPTAAEISTKDMLGNKLAENETSDLGNNKIQPEIKSVTVLDEENLIIEFTGSIDSSDVSDLEGDILVVQGSKTISGATNFSASLDGGASTSKFVLVELQNNHTIDVSKPVIVRTVSQDLMDIVGVNGALLKANTTGVESEYSFVVSSGTISDYDLLQGTIQIVTDATAATAASIATTANATNDVDLSAAGATEGTVTINGVAYEIDIAGLSGITATSSVADIVTHINAKLTQADAPASISGTHDDAVWTITTHAYGDGSTVAVSGALFTALGANGGAWGTATAGADNDFVTVAGVKYIFVDNPNAAAIAPTGTVIVDSQGSQEATATALAAAIVEQSDLDVDRVGATITVTYLVTEDYDGDFITKDDSNSGEFTINAESQAFSLGDFTIEFNRNVDTATIATGWNGSAPRLVANAAEFDATANTVTIEGFGVFTLTGVDADATVDVTFTKVDNRTIKVEFEENHPTIDTTAVYFKADKDIKSTGGTSISTVTRTIQ